MYALLFSLPGTPVLYYGDEIGMGDNIYLGDRDGVRTPMQWSADRNAGFSRANPQKLYLPVVIDPEYHYETVNVEAQQGNPLVPVMVGQAADHAAEVVPSLRPRFARAASPRELQGPGVRSHPSRMSGSWWWPICLGLSSMSISISRNMPAWSPRKCWAELRSRKIGDQPYLLTLGPHGFIWFSLPAALSS